MAREVQRFVTVRFKIDGEVVREDYGPFVTMDQLTRWFDRRDDDQRFGPYAKFTIRRLGLPDVTAEQRPAKRAAVKKTAARRSSG